MFTRSIWALANNDQEVLTLYGRLPLFTPKYVTLTHWEFASHWSTQFLPSVALVWKAAVEPRAGDGISLLHECTPLKAVAKANIQIQMVLFIDSKVPPWPAEGGGRALTWHLIPASDGEVAPNDSSLDSNQRGDITRTGWSSRRT